MHVHSHFLSKNCLLLFWRRQEHNLCCYFIVSNFSLQDLWCKVIVNCDDQNVLEFNKDTHFNGFPYSAIIFYN